MSGGVSRCCIVRYSEWVQFVKWISNLWNDYVFMLLHVTKWFMLLNNIIPNNTSGLTHSHSLIGVWIYIYALWSYRTHSITLHQLFHCPFPGANCPNATQPIRPITINHGYRMFCQLLTMAESDNANDSFGLITATQHHYRQPVQPACSINRRPNAARNSFIRIPTLLHWSMR